MWPPPVPNSFLFHFPRERDFVQRLSDRNIDKMIEIDQEASYLKRLLNKMEKDKKKQELYKPWLIINYRMDPKEDNEE